jgi:copper chaperone
LSAFLVLCHNDQTIISVEGVVSLSHYVISVPDMSCHHCVARITKVLEEKEVAAFKVLLESKTVEVETDDVAGLLAALDDAGYPGTVQ